MLSRLSRVPQVRRVPTTFAQPIASAISRSRPVYSQWIRGYADDKRPSLKGTDLYRTPSPKKKAAQPPASNAKANAAKAKAAPTPSSESAPAAKEAEPSPAAEETEVREPSAASEDDKPISFDSLPDLTRGIPSTLEYESTGSTRSALTAVPEDGGRGRGKGELPASAYISSTDRNRDRTARWGLAATLATIVIGAGYMGRNWEDEEEAARHPDAPNDWGMGLWWKRSTTRWSDIMTYYQEPAFEKLLPKVDPLLEKPYTLCISLEDMLVHSEWSREHGWRVAKRPGVDYFLRYLSQYYELVLFTTVSAAIASPVVAKLDPFQIIMFPLFREATKYKDGEFVKDLSYLNRDLSKVIILDTDPKHVSAQPENAIVLPKWTGDAKNDDLVALVPFLEYIHTMQYSDVRKVLKSFEGKHIPTEFARREAIARAEFQKQLATQKRAKSGSGMGFLGSLLGLKPSNMSMMVSPDGEPSPSEAFAQGKMIQDIARERGQRYYEMLEKDIRENGDRYLKEQQAMMEKQQQEAMAGMMGSLGGMFVPAPTGDNASSASPAK